MTRSGGIGRLLRQLQSEDWLSRVIDQYFNVKYPEHWTDKPSPNIHPSAAGSTCELELELGMLGHRSSITGSSRRRMDRGSDAHDRWERYLGDMGILIQAEVPFKLADPMVSARMDAVIQHPASGHLTVVEIKTVHNQGFKRLPPSTSDRQQNMAMLYKWNVPWGRWYCLQLTWYYTRGDYKGTRFKEAVFLFEDTNNQDFKVIYVEPTDEMVREAYEKPVLAQKAFLEGRLLSRPFQRGSAACKRCERKSVCNLLEDGDTESWAMVQTQLKKAGIRPAKQKS